MVPRPLVPAQHELRLAPVARDASLPAVSDAQYRVAGGGYPAVGTRLCWGSPGRTAPPGSVAAAAPVCSGRRSRPAPALTAAADLRGLRSLCVRRAGALGVSPEPLAPLPGRIPRGAMLPLHAGVGLGTAVHL